MLSPISEKSKGIQPVLHGHIWQANCSEHTEADPTESSVSNRDELWVHIEGTVKTVDNALQVGYALYTEEGVQLYMSTFNDGREEEWPEVHKGGIRFSSPLPQNLLNKGRYRLALVSALYCREWICKPDVNSPQIILSIDGQISDSPYWRIGRPGILVPEISWHTQKLSPDNIR